jgi:hypothetical protein
VYRSRLLSLLMTATVLFLVGIDWGLPTRDIDPLLFGGEGAWSGDRLAELVGPDVLSAAHVAADVDVNPLADTAAPVELTARPEQRAELIVRYRLYSYQPDEMITFRALYKARHDLDPKLYQYGGLFLYSVGAALELAQIGRLVPLRDDLAFYLDRPEMFARLYIAARLVVLIYGLLGVVVCYLLARRLGGERAGALGALVFTQMPVTINMVHEAKPHLPAAVWMLAAVLLAGWYIRAGGWRRCAAAAAAGGLAMAMVLSAWPIWLVLPAMLLGRKDGWRVRAGRLVAATLLFVTIYVLFNPFVAIHLFANRAVLRSNLANSAAMYRVGDLGQGLHNLIRLSAEAAGPALLVIGLVGVAWLCVRRRGEAATLLLPAAMVLATMAAVGAGKPGEFARFGMFAYAILAVLSGCAAARLLDRWRRAGAVVAVVLVAATAWLGLRYLHGFCIDAYGRPTRLVAAQWLADHCLAHPAQSIGVVQEPAPYAMGPLDFAQRRVVLLPHRRPAGPAVLPDWLVVSADRREALYGQWWLAEYQLAAAFPSEPLGRLDRPTPISWAHKPVFVFRRREVEPEGGPVVARADPSRSLREPLW